MFKNNEKHGEMELFATHYEMNEKLRSELKGHWSTTFYSEVFTKIDETIFKELYHHSLGRRNFPVNILTSLEIMKEMEKITDIQLLDQYRFNLSYRNAMGTEDINQNILAPRTLYYFRSAIAEYELNNGKNLLEICFSSLRDKVLKVYGIKTDIQRGDSVYLGANIKKMSRLMLFHKCTSNLVKELKKQGITFPEEVNTAISEDEDSYIYKLVENEYAVKTQWLADTLYNLVTQNLWHKSIRKTKAYKQAVRVIHEQCKIDKGCTTDAEKVVLKKGTEISSGSMQNPSDEDATYRKKNGKAYRGSKVQAMETCSTENPFQVITDIKVKKNNIDDADILVEQLNTMPDNIKPSTVIADGGLITEKVKEKVGEAVKMVQSGIRGTTLEKMKERVKLSDFQFNENGGVLSCPEGHAPRSVSIDENGNHVANFNPKHCQNCKLKNQCIVSSTKKQSRLVLNSHIRNMENLRENMSQKGYWELAKLRPEVESLMGLIKGGNLTQRTKFCGTIRISTRVFLRGIAINFKRIRYFLTEPSKKKALATQNA